MYEDYEDITELFLAILHEADSLDVAESEFKYRDWCHEVGNSERNGFIDFCEEYLQDRDEVWDNLNDFDEDE